MDYSGDARGVRQVARFGLCSFRRDLAPRQIGRRALWRVAWKGILRRIDVSPTDRCIESCVGNAGRKTKTLGFPLHRLANDDRTYDASRRQGDAPAHFPKASPIGAATFDQARQMAHRWMSLQ